MRLRSLLLVVVLLGVAGGVDARSPCPLAQEQISPERALRVGGHLVAERSREGLRRVEDVTGYCLSCHDDTVAAGILLRGRSEGATGRLNVRVESIALHRSHPVDVPYAGTRDGYRSAAEIDSRIPLPAGEVTCLSCHGGADPSRLFLSITVRGSRLCLECHRK